MTDQLFTWCFIGTGTLARQVAEEITSSGRHRITAVFSRRFDAASRFARQYGGTAYDDAARAMMNADAVYVVTPHPAHYPFVKQAVALGRPVLCEKPFTVSASTRNISANMS